MNSSPRFFGRWLIAATLAAIALWAIVWHSSLQYTNGHFDRERSYAAHWPNVIPFNLPGVDPPAFYDLQVLLWGIDVAAHGRDPYHEPPPAGTPYWYNYPRVWFQFAVLGINLDWTRPIGLVLAAAFLASVVFVTRPGSAGQFFWMLALLLCPPTLEALAYANNDLIIFVLLSTAALCWASRRPLGGWPTFGVIGLAALLKLYPACTLLALIDGRRRALIVACGTGAILAGFFALHLNELRTVSAQTPRPHYRAMGSQVLTSRLLDGATRHPATMARLEATASLAVWQRVLPVATSATLLSLLGICAWLGVRHHSQQSACGEPQHDARSVARVAFHLGACVYLAVFAIGHNYMHREIMFILVGPWLLADCNRRWLALLILPVTWLAAVPTGPVYLSVQIATWVLAAGFTYWLARDLARDIFTALRSPMALTA